MKNRRGFTLIELLIVVAIIGILAAITVPNFLCSLVKAKVARVQADLMTLSTSIEIYRIDNNKIIQSYGDMTSNGIPVGEFWVWSQLTTPVPYILSGVEDPFKIEHLDRKRILPLFVEIGVYGFRKDDENNWRIYSIGPSQEFGIASFVPYHSSNGCQSEGGIIRTNEGPIS